MNRLVELLQTMDVPKTRLELNTANVAWLMRNLGVRNSNHPDFEEAIRLLGKTL